MKKNIYLLLVSFCALSACVSSKPIQGGDPHEPILVMSIFQGRGQSIKIFCDDKLVLRRDNLQPVGSNDISAITSVPKSGKAMIVTVKVLPSKASKSIVIKGTKRSILDIVILPDGVINFIDASTGPSIP